MQVEEVSAAVFEDGVGAAVVHLLRLAHEHDCLRLQLLVGAAAVVGAEGDRRRTSGPPRRLERDAASLMGVRNNSVPCGSSEDTTVSQRAVPR
jgi:hypothetical protein